MATDGYHIFFNSIWTSKLTQSELRGVIAHEVLHVIFQHSARRLNREAVKWNVAADHAINLLLIEQGFLLPSGGLVNQNYGGLATEEIYALLPAGASFEKKRLIKSSRNDEESDNSGDIPRMGADVLDPDGLWSAGLRDPDMPDAAQLNELCDELRREAQSKLHGDAAANFQAECRAIEEGKIDWKDLLRCWLIDRIKNDWSMWPYSKKHIHRGLFMPSIGIEAPGHIVFAIDTSGSMSTAELADIFSEIRMYRETFPCRLTVIQADAAIQTVVTYEELDGEDVPKDVKIVGRGGTDFRPVFSWVDENAPGAYVMYATDGLGTFPITFPTGDVIWLLVKGHRALHEFPFGLCVKLR